MSKPSRPPLGTGLHVAIIMDGNGRWAQRRGLPRTRGHRAGVEAVRRVAEASLEEGVGILSLFAFSCDNWHRPVEEVSGLFDLLTRYLEEVRGGPGRGVRFTVIGRRDRIPPTLGAAIARAEEATSGERRMWLRLAVDYSSRESIVRAVNLRAWHGLSRPATPDSFGRLVATPVAPTAWRPTAAEVDLLIRTGGERRLSDFLLWESAYAELLFSEIKWPDFGADDLRAALRDYRGRHRRFGRLAAS